MATHVADAYLYRCDVACAPHCDDGASRQHVQAPPPLRHSPKLRRHLKLEGTATWDATSYMCAKAAQCNRPDELEQALPLADQKADYERTPCHNDEHRVDDGCDPVQPEPRQCDEQARPICRAEQLQVQVRRGRQHAGRGLH